MEQKTGYRVEGYVLPNQGMEKKAAEIIRFYQLKYDIADDGTFKIRTTILDDFPDAMAQKLALCGKGQVTFFNFLVGNTTQYCFDGVNPPVFEIF